jgi:hypothetical protein
MDLAALNHYLRAVAIVFDFMNPVLALWRLIDRGRKLRFDESKSGVKYAEHGGGKQVALGGDTKISHSK